MSLMVLDYKLVKLGPDMGQSEFLRRQAQTCACVRVLQAFLYVCEYVCVYIYIYIYNIYIYFIKNTYFFECTLRCVVFKTLFYLVFRRTVFLLGLIAFYPHTQTNAHKRNK